MTDIRRAGADISQVFTQSPLSEIDKEQALKRADGLGFASTLSQSVNNLQDTVYEPSKPILEQPSRDAAPLKDMSNIPKQAKIDPEEQVRQILEVNDIPPYGEQASTIKNSSKKAIDNAATKLTDFKKFIQSSKPPPSNETMKQLEQILSSINGSIDEFKKTLENDKNTDTKAGLKDYQNNIEKQISNLNEKLGNIDISKISPGNLSDRLAIHNLQSSVKEMLNQVSSTIQQLNNMGIDAAKSFVDNNSNQTFIPAALKKELQSKVANGEITQEQADKALSDFYNGIPNPIVDKFKLDQKIDSGFIPDKTGHDAELMGKVDDLLKQLLPGLGLSKEQMGQVEYLFYNRDAAFPGKAIADNLEAQIRQKLGLTGDAKTPINQAGFNSKAWGEFAFNFRQNIEKLSPADQAAVMGALQNPQAPQTPEVKKLIEQLNAETLAQVKGTNILPMGWIPPIEVLASIGNTNPGMQIVNNAVKQLNDYAVGIQNMASQMKDGPKRADLMNILKLVQEALSDLKKLLAEAQIKDAGIAQKFSKAELETTLNKIEKQRKDQMEQMKNKGKPSVGAIFGKIFKFIAAIMLTVMLAPVGGGGIGAALLATAVASQVSLCVAECVTGKNLLEQAVKAVSDFVIDVMTPLIGKAGARALAALTNGMMITAICAMCGPWAGAYIAAGPANMGKNVMLAMGVPDKIASICGMVVSIAADVAVLIATMVLTLGTGIVAALIEFNAMITTIVSVLGALAFAFTIGNTLAEAVVNLKLSKSMERRAILAEAMELLSTMIKNLQNIIKKLFQGIEEMSDMIKFTGETNKNIFDSASRALSEVVR